MVVFNTIYPIKGIEFVLGKQLVLCLEYKKYKMNLAHTINTGEGCGRGELSAQN